MVLLVYSAIGTLILAKYRNFTAFVTPASIVFLYISLSMTIGAWGHSVGAVLLRQQYLDYLSLQRTDEALALFMFTLALLVPASRLIGSRANLECTPIQFPKKPLYLSIVVLSPFLLFDVDLAVLGGSGTLNSIPKALISISAILLFANMRGGQRYFLYLLLIALISSISAFNKREAIFLIFVILFLEAHNGRLKLSFSLALKALLAIISVVTLILWMSIFRGYGSYDVDSFLSAFNYIYPYLTSEQFLASFLFNIEANYFYFHAINSIELVLSYPEFIELGRTIVKFLFLPIPRDIFPWKPDSAIHLYTLAYDPAYRALGGSWPINLISEFIWNFWLLAPLATGFLAWLFAKLESAMVSCRLKQNSLMMIFFLFIYMNTVTLARGSGFDQYVFELLTAYSFILLIRIAASALRLFPTTNAHPRIFAK